MQQHRSDVPSTVRRTVVSRIKTHHHRPASRWRMSPPLSPCSSCPSFRDAIQHTRPRTFPYRSAGGRERRRDPSQPGNIDGCFCWDRQSRRVVSSPHSATRSQLGDRLRRKRCDYLHYPRGGHVRISRRFCVLRAGEIHIGGRVLWPKPVAGRRVAPPRGWWY